MTKQPNVLLIMCDQMRGDCLGMDGHPDVKTPYLDTLAADGMLFENAYSACPSCIPARAALFTGRTPAGTGRVGYKDGVTWEYDHMLAQEMRDGGYQTAVVGKMHVHPPRLGCGFEHIRPSTRRVEQYFDLDADPRECVNLIDRPERAERIAELRALLIEELAGREEGYVKDGELRVGCRPAVNLEHPRC